MARESLSHTLRVGLYARVSTLNNQSPEMQLAELREYVALVHNKTLDLVARKPRLLSVVCVSPKS